MRRKNNIALNIDFSYGVKTSRQFWAIRMANVLQELKDINNNIPLCSCSELTEQDIPGARLSKQPEKCKVSDLRVWLQCRGQTVRTKLTKAELCLRVKRCQESGEDYTFVDPYPGQPHLVRKRNNCKKCSTQSDCKHITPENKNLIWCNDASVLPKAFNYLNLLEHSKKSGKKQESVEKPLNRGYSFFHDGYVHEVLIFQETIFFLTFQCFFMPNIWRNIAPFPPQNSIFFSPTSVKNSPFAGVC